jgi:hypothetical protein
VGKARSLFSAALFWLNIALCKGLPLYSNGTAWFFAFKLIIEGTTEKVLQFVMPLQSIYNQNLCFDE